MRIYDPRLGRFLSVDLIAKQYPELTPYQFASNTPIQAIDLDGLERYFAADGSFLGKSATSTEIMVVTNAAVITTAKYNLAHPNWDHKWLNAHSVKGYDNPDQAAVEWAFKFQGKTHGFTYNEKLGLNPANMPQ
jgi:uncharacterized protein RhaS with RHS repeats